MTAEKQRLQEDKDKKAVWKRWGPYLSERAWGTVREDYSADGAAWDYFPFDQARSKAYRWNEDGIAGFCDRRQRICFAMAFWNGKDPFLKERLFGLNNPEGNHGEDVKEYYYYLDSTPTHSYVKQLYKYPQAEFPYQRLRDENRSRGKDKSEFELIDTGVFDEDRYFDITVEYAKFDAEDICIRVTAENRGPEEAALHLLPTIWFRNTWSWANDCPRPLLKAEEDGSGLSVIHLEEELRGVRRLYCAGGASLLFTENETNYERVYQGENKSAFVKDGINDLVVGGNKDAVCPELHGTKAAAHYHLTIPAHGKEVIYLRFTDKKLSTTAKAFPKNCEKVFTKRKQEADEFYAEIIPAGLSDDAKNVMRQALGGTLCSKQFYHYIVKTWLDGDPVFSPPPAIRKKGRNARWTHLYNEDVISMPDKWEYPWYAAWDLAFHCITLAMVDAEFAKEQLILMLREWYMHPNGQIPAYEWKFDDVNPPVHAWAALRVYQMDGKRSGIYDRSFLEKIFHKLLLNFTWWVNRKDPEDNNVFEGGFLGMDNIGVFDRSAPMPNGGHLEQSDGTSFMAMYCLNLLAIAFELAKEDKAYEDVASKFFEHFVQIADAMNNIGQDNIELWSEQDGFYYDVLHINGQHTQLKVCSMVGLIPLFAVETLEEEWLTAMPDFKKRMDWFLKNRPDLTDQCANLEIPGNSGRILLAVVNRDRLRRVLQKMLSETQFLSDHGIRALSRHHLEEPFVFHYDGGVNEVAYEPAESRSGLFGGNSNWRGPVWFPPNYLLIESLQKFHYYYGDDLKVEFPTGSGKMLDLWEVSQELSRRLSSIFLKDQDNRRAVFGNDEKFQADEHFRDHILFYEYFHGDNGRGLGASHQTGWTGLVAKLLQQSGE
ncbi:MAG TPA: hypothetical protein VGO50_01740 [Pyrinomonadaceae bacterium]|nr:hypothetical protein [Pyrinomonadaceae bacterium]